MFNFYMLCSGVQCWIFGKTYNNSIVTKDMDFTLVDTIVFKLVLYPEKLRAQQLATSIYSTSALDNVVEPCFLHIQVTKLPPIKWQLPLALFLSTLSPA